MQIKTTGSKLTLSPRTITWLKVVGVFGFGLALYLQIKGWPKGPELQWNLHKLGGTLFGWDGLIALLLVFLNIGMEASKWWVLLRDRHPISFRQAFENIITGWTLGIFTPQRIGEYAGRLIGFDQTQRPLAVYYTFVSSIAQNFSHLIGVIPFLIWGIVDSPPPIPGIGGVGILLLGIGIVIYLYFRIDDLVGYLHRRLGAISYLKNILPSTYFPISSETLGAVLFLSLIRYGAYLSLFVHLLHLLVPEIAVVDLYLYLPIVFLLQSSIPLPPAIAFLARIEFAVLALRGLSIAPGVIAVAGLVLWVLNLLLPSLLGIGLLLRYKPKIGANKIN